MRWKHSSIARHLVPQDCTDRLVINMVAEELSTEKHQKEGTRTTVEFGDKAKMLASSNKWRQTRETEGKPRIQERKLAV